MPGEMEDESNAQCWWDCGAVVRKNARQAAGAARVACEANWRRRKTGAQETEGEEQMR